MDEPVNIFEGMRDFIENHPGFTLSKMEDSTIYLKDASGWYPIELDRCDTHLKMVAWIDHLTRKSWATKEHIKEFIAHCFCAKEELARDLHLHV
jgi:hypothetical protein